MMARMDHVTQEMQRMLEIPRRLLGSPKDAVPTPGLILDVGRVESNIAEMARRMGDLPAALRPHAKIHKSPILGQMQLDAGAIGLTTATVWEASAMIDAGLSDVLIANQVVGPVKAAELARIAVLGRVIVAVESASNAVELAEAAARAGGEINVLVELDVGLHRSGVRSVEEAVALGKQVEEFSGLRLAGLLGYEGHCMLEPDRRTRVEKAKAANDLLIEAADEFERHGLATDIVAAGGLGTWDITGANPRITEIHAGSYIFMDAFHRNLVPGFEVALTVLATVVSRSGDLAVLDCGRKSIGIDRTLPEVVRGDGVIRFEHGEHFIHEEHTALDLPPGSTLAVGDLVELMPGYAPTTVNHYDVYFVVADDKIVDVWPILARYGASTSGVGPAPGAV
jgi:D-serine deaminase-like pyridoxal phosphate-dependent protein